VSSFAAWNEENRIHGMHATAPLFEADPLRLADDGEGGIVYWPRFVDAGTARTWFERLQAHADWSTLQRPMYDRIVDVPRLQASIALAGSGRAAQFETVLDRIRAIAPAPYTHVGLNFYRDGRDSVAMHHDHTQDLVAGAPIAVLSLGAPRDMLVRRRQKGARALRITLEPGSVMVMSHASQSTHEHGIPKTTRLVGPRISCAFRARRREFD
jgi:alkylated DNA repair dioxygenase AlkB